jgi:hypothetical protein
MVYLVEALLHSNLPQDTQIDVFVSSLNAQSLEVSLIQ